MNSKGVGERTLAIILSKLIEAEYSVSIPFGNNERYDLILDSKGKLLKAQCKTGRYRNGTVAFNTSSLNLEKGKWIRHNYKGQVDIFLVYCDELKKMYCVPANHTSDSEMRLRIDEPKHKYPSAIKWAKDYEFPRPIIDWDEILLQNAVTKMKEDELVIREQAMISNPYTQ